MNYKNLNLAIKQNLVAVYNYRFGSEIRLKISVFVEGLNNLIVPLMILK